MKKTSRIKRIGIFYRPDNKEAAIWNTKIIGWLKKEYPTVKVSDKQPKALIVLGGDGTILEAARKFQNSNPVIVGLNLGQVGFLASVREPKQFLPALKKFLSGDYVLMERMMIAAQVLRNNKEVFATNSLNEVSVQSLLGIAEIEVDVNEHPVQYIRGSGVLVATPTGSTAYNLSAHGPIVMPDIKCFIITELMDHNIPTPSLVIKRTKEVSLKILNFRKRNLLNIAKTNKPVDVLLAADGEIIFPLEKGDVIKINFSPRLVKFAELEKNYFFRSLQEKFAFK